MGGGFRELKGKFSKEEIQLARIHLKNCSISSAQENEVKIISRFHLTSVRLTIIQMTINIWGNGTLTIDRQVN